MTPDSELLASYARTGSEDAFAELVRRHIDLVYSAALRQVRGDIHLAQDAAQGVFSDLARKAPSLSRLTSLSGWLYTSAHFAATKLLRGETRRREREQEAHAMQDADPNSAPGPAWESIKPVLDEVMHELKQADREAVLLRYFENRPFAELGAKLGLSENAARMRVERALEKLRARLARRGVTTTAELASVVSANAVGSAPAGLAATFTGSSLSSAAALSSWKFMILTRLKLGFGALAVAGAVTTVVLQHQALQRAAAANTALRQKIAALETDVAGLSNRLALAADPKPFSNLQLAELLRLRAEVTRLRQQRRSETAEAPPATNEPPAGQKIEINVKSRFVSVPAGSVQSMGVAWMSNGRGGGIGLLTEQQFDIIRKALDGASDVNVIGAPQITTFSGGAASLSVARSMPVDDTNADIGIRLNLTPSFSTNSRLFQLNLAACLTELTGDPSRPGIQTMQLTNQLSLPLGQTAVLQQDIPPGGWLPDSTNLPAGPRSLLVFVTPQVVNSRGRLRYP